jgi:molecular chaperone GrpE
MAEENLEPTENETSDQIGSEETADPIDQELADLVEQTGPISKEAELLADLQRLQAEFVNYKTRVERDRDQARNSAIVEVLRSLLPALDDLERAEAHGDLEGTPFMAVVTKIRSAGDKFGLKKFAVKGEKFDPEIHNALAQVPSKDVTEPTINEVVEAGFMIDDRLIRPAMVSVLVPEQD